MVFPFFVSSLEGSPVLYKRQKVLALLIRLLSKEVKHENGVVNLEDDHKCENDQKRDSYPDGLSLLLVIIFPALMQFVEGRNSE